MYLAALLLSAWFSYRLKAYWEENRRVLTSRNVIRVLRKSFKQKGFSEEESESEVEQKIATCLSGHFDAVQSQAPLGGRAQARERIDLDLGPGKVGIEIKLARFLRKSNERNRLIGQVELYLNRKYRPENLIVLIVGPAPLHQDPALYELRDILLKKRVRYVYWPTLPALEEA